MADWKAQYIELWNKTTTRQRQMIIGVAVLVFAAIFGWSYWYGNRPELVPLYTGLETKDAGDVTSKLKEAGVPYEVQEGKDGATILVPKQNVHDARLDLATQGLPRGHKGFELFDDSKLGVTEFQNKVNYLQALQGELTRTIEQIEVIEKARVHIVLPEDSLYKKNEKPATASIMLRLYPEKTLSKKEIRGITNLVAHSIQGLLPENITIVNDRGKILNDPEEDSDKAKDESKKTLDQLEMTKKVEERIQANLQSLLDQALGEGKAFVRVSVELDFDQRLTDKAVYTPVVDDAGIIRSQQDISETYTGNSQVPGGPAGTQSNIPGYVATNGNARADYEKKETTKNYEINEEKSKIVASPGSIRHLNVGVLVNDELTAAQQESIRKSVASAAGIDVRRGDTISVEPVPFSNELANRRAAEEQKVKDAEMRQTYIIVGVILLLLLIAAAIFFYRRRQAQLAAEAAAAAEAQRRAEEEAARRAEEARQAAEFAEMRRQAIANGEEPPEVPKELTEEEKRAIEEREAVETLVNTQPAEAAMLIKSWLSEE
ncbi:MAG: flagellar basal-body MS-ring/collar protein FliF [Selenomonadaceae bacterium]|nr:flagellar basal-body MS-ring/collar protein FliF [Selenomonadaceae bacterium]